MPRKETDYSKTVIYKIVCNDLTITDIYVGHTTDFVVRKYGHKTNCNNVNSKRYNLKVYTMIRNNGGWDNWTMVEVEKYPCSDGNEAATRERHYFELLNARMNSIVPIRTNEEKKKQIIEACKSYYQNNKEVKKLKQKKYDENNKESRLLRQKQYYKTNKEAILLKIKEYQLNNKDEIKEYKKKNYQKNKLKKEVELIV